MRLLKKSLSKVTLTDLLRRKRTTLEKFLLDTGIVTYELLVSRCSSIGVLPPTQEQFMKAKGNPITHEYSSPMEGIVVLNPPPISELSLNKSDGTVALESSDQMQEILPESESPVNSTVKSKKKKKKEETDQES